jgi:hypothetical protein
MSKERAPISRTRLIITESFHGTRIYLFCKKQQYQKKVNYQDTIKMIINDKSKFESINDIVPEVQPQRVRRRRLAIAIEYWAVRWAHAPCPTPEFN